MPHLSVHSHFSLCRGADTIDALCAAARARGFSRLALTDRNGLYGLVRFLESAREHGLAPIVGAEAATDTERAVLLARDRSGYASLCRILSALHAAARPVPHISDLCPVPSALSALSAVPIPLASSFSLSACIAQHRPGLIVLSDSPRLLRTVSDLSGPDDLFFEMRHTPTHPAAPFPPVASNDIHFVDAPSRARHLLLRAIARNTTLARLRPHDPDLASPHAWLKPPDAFAHAFRDCPEALANAERIAERCATDWSFGAVVQPRFPLPPGVDAFEHLRVLVEAGAHRRYGAGYDDRVRARLAHEFELIRAKGFVDYFLVVHDIVRRSGRTCGRGSAAASAVAYCLGITHVDPVRHNLYFERFLNPGRNDPPDIDVDFPWDERDGVLAEVFRSYTRAHSAMIANHVTFQPRAAVREVAKVYGMPEAEIADITDRLGWFWEPHGIDELVASHPLFADVDLRPPWPEILKRAQEIVGFPRHLSVHCGGVVITPAPITDYVPVEPAAKGVDIIQWEKDAAEDAGLVKIDLLGNRSLAVIRDAVAAVKENTGRAVDFGQVKPLDDPDTIDLLAQGKTMGVFYVESPAMRQLQQKTRRGDFEHLTLHSSIIRPAANAFIREYVRRLRGGTWAPLHPAFEEILRESYGIMSYQEDISKVAIALAGFDVTDADRLRRILSKKDHQKKLEDYRRRFYEGSLARGVARETVDAIWAMIESFRGYSFCKPHSASYALVSFESAWLRAHYPAEFMAGVISNQGGYYTTFAYVSEARRMGLTVLPPDVNESRRAWTGKDRALRIGLMQVKGLKEAALAAVLAGRKDGPYASIEDFLARTALDPSDARLLVRAGALDRLGASPRTESGARPCGEAPPRTRPEMMWRMKLREAGRGKARQRGQLSLFPEVAPDVLPARVPDFDEEEMLVQEVDTLGFLASRHPLTLYAEALRGVRTVAAKDLGRHVGKRVTMVGWWVTGKVVQTKKGEPMEFVSFEDTSEIYETTFFPEAYAKFCRMLSHAKPYLLTGKVEEEFGAVAVTVETLRFLGGRGG